MNNKRILSFLTAFLLTVFSFSACSEGRTNENADSQSQSNTTGTNETAAAEEDEEITLATVRQQYADRNYEGYDFRIADNGDGWWGTIDVYAEEITGEVINDAVFNRNSAMEETLNIHISEFRCIPPSDTVKRSVIAGTDDYDALMQGLDGMASLATSRYIMDFTQIDSIKLKSDWWDQALITDMSILGHSYFLTGDISVMDDYGTWCYLFNKQLIADYNLENPYELVDSGKWTIDKHNDMASVVLSDMNGDGKWTSDDNYGFVTETYNNVALWSGFGFRICEKNEEDLPYFTYNEEASISALMKVLDTQFAPFTNLGSGSTVGASDSREEQFKKGGSLFYFAGMINITNFRDSDTDFGILPSPKYNEEQPRYYNSYSFCNFVVYGMPITSADPERVGDIMECMAHFSVYTLTPAYYDYTLIGKSTRDQESEPMIELIMKTRNYDLGIIFDWGGLRSNICSFSSPDVVASKFAALTKVSNKMLEKFISGLLESE